MAVFISNNQTFTVNLQGDLISQAGRRAYVYGGLKTHVLVKFPVTTDMRVVKVEFGEPSIRGFEVYTYPVMQGVAVRSQAVEFSIGNAIRQLINIGIDITHIMFTSRTMGGTTNDTLSIQIDIKRGIPYSDVLAPCKQEIATVLPNYAYSRECITPPNVMYMPTVGLAYQLPVDMQFESNIAHMNSYFSWFEEVNGRESPIVSFGRDDSTLRVSQGATAVLLYNDETFIRRWDITSIETCHEWVIVRWTSQTGAQRQHYFPIVSFGNEGTDAVELLTVANGRRVIKNSEKSVTCRVVGLTPYGCWYYQDLLMASDVHAIIVKRDNVFDFEMENENTAAEVVGGMTDTPDGNGVYNFEFKLKLARYDTH